MRICSLTNGGMKDSLKIVLFFFILIWLAEVYNLASGRSLVSYGILPRHIEGLPGIILHPFIHGSLQHVMSNSIPLLILGFIVALEGAGKFFKVTLFILIVGGSLLWLLGRASYHVGASLLIFGYFGYIIVNAFHKRSAGSVLAAIITIVMYGGLIYGLIPAANHISWEGHLFGLIAGIFSVKSIK